MGHLIRPADYFGGEGASNRPFLQGHVAYQTLDAEFDLLPGEIIYSEWKTYGGSLSGGFEIAIGENLKILPVLSPGYGSLGSAPLALVGILGATDIFGPHRDALAFDRFFEVGLGLEADVSAHG